MNKKLTMVFCALALIWMIVIFCFSAQPSASSSAMSSPLAETLVDVLYPSFETKPVEEQLRLLDFWTLVIRKCAHFAEYTVLGLLLVLAYGSCRSTQTGKALFETLRPIRVPLIAFLIGAAYAASDELHQRFVPGRSGRISDVLLDSAGVLTGVLLMWLFAQIKSARRYRQAHKSI